MSFVPQNSDIPYTHQSQLIPLIRQLHQESLNNNDDVDNSEMPNAIPLGAIFSNIFGKNSDNSESSSSSEKKKVKVDKKPKDKKKKALDTFGTNLTFKAKNNEIDMVVGRNKEIPYFYIKKKFVA